VLALSARTAVGSLELDVTASVGAGQCLALAGPSGAGKTSVLRVVAGLLTPREGRVRCGDAAWLDTAAGVDLPPERRRCGYLFQEYALFGHLSAWRNVAYPLRGLPRDERERRARALLERFGLGGRADARPRELSGGERQRVALARALARDPHVLLLDEPLSALAARTRASSARELARALREAGVPAILVTHDFLEAAELAGRVAVMDAGRVVQEGTAAELAAVPASSFVADFTGAVVLAGNARPGPSGLTTVALDGGGEVRSTDVAQGRVAACVHPWDIGLEPPGVPPADSARNRLDAEILTVTPVGNRTRVGLVAGQPLVAEVTGQAAAELGLRPGMRVWAAWKATATRLADL
jgi:molybdate transport system ATP-binding protein